MKHSTIRIAKHHFKPLFKPQHQSIDFEALKAEFLQGLKAVEESKKEFNERFEGKTQEGMAQELETIYDETLSQAQKDGVTIINADDSLEKQAQDVVDILCQNPDVLAKLKNIDDHLVELEKERTK